MSSTPTPAQIATVQANLKNMQALNDFIYNHGQSRVLNAYLLLSQQDDSDPGLTVGLNILEGTFWAIGSELGPVGNFVASFLSGMVSWWSTNTPPILNSVFASLLIRLQQTSLAIDKTLAVYYQDVPGNWNVMFTYNGQSQTLSDLANITIPQETDPLFETLAQAAILALDKQVWKTVLAAKFVITQFVLSSGPIFNSGDQDHPPITFTQDFIAANPSYYWTWKFHQGTGCGNNDGWLGMEYNIGTGASTYSSGSMAATACAYLFMDSAYGQIINPNGLYPRATVFTLLGIPHATQTNAVGGGGEVADKLSMSYLRAMKAGTTLGQLVAERGREEVERQVIAKAHADPVFATELAMRPRETVEKFFGIKIPEVVSFSVIVETPRTFALVVPLPKGDETPPSNGSTAEGELSQSN